MRITKRGLGILLIVFVMMIMTATTAMAAARKKISSMNVTVESNIQRGTKFGDEEIDVTFRSGNYTYDTYEIVNTGFAWEDDMVPEITLYFTAADDYYFSLTRASEIKLTGAVYVKAVLEEGSSRTVLKLTVKLPSLSESLGELTAVDMYNTGYAMWDAVEGAGSYQLRLYRNGNIVSHVDYTTKEPYYNFKEKILRSGSYSCKVRAINEINSDNKTQWVDSNVVEISTEQVDKIRSGEVSIPMRGNWKSDAAGYWYEHSDGAYTKNGWEEIDGQWYFFDENGYMKTGWIEWEEKRYYCDDSGKMLRNATTPDGTELDNDGNPKTGR